MQLDDASLLPPEGMLEEVGFHFDDVCSSIQLMLIHATDVPNALQVLPTNFVICSKAECKILREVLGIKQLSRAQFCR